MSADTDTHIAVFNGMLRNSNLHLTKPEEAAIRAAIALMRGQSEVQTLLAEYMREYDNPAPDYTYRHLLRERLFKVAKGPSR